MTNAASAIVIAIAPFDSDRAVAWCDNRWMKVVVSGASGLIGTALVPALRAGGHEVLRLVRHEPTGPDEIRWDPAAGNLDASRLHGIDALVNLSGATIAQRWTESRKEEIRESRVRSTSLLAETAATLSPRPRIFLCAGGTGIYGDRGDEILTEGSELGSGFLADVCRSWEAASEPARTAGLRVVHMRQGIVLTKDGGALAKLLTPFKLGVGGRVGSGKQWWSWISMDDYVSSARFLLENDIAGTVNVTAPDPVTNAQFTRALGKALGRPTIVPVPAIALKTMFGSAMAEETLLTGQRVLPQRLVDAGFEFAAPTIDVGLAHALA